MDPQANPFAAFSLIVAPAILTNASSVLAMSTSNRLARAVDRARDLARQLETMEATAEIPAKDSHDSFERRLQELTATEQRTTMLLRVLQSFYLALAGFASSTLAALLGAALGRFESGPILTFFVVVAVGAGTVGVLALVRGSVILVRETAIAVRVISERAASVRARARLH
jgi:HAMP domain-containing protein